MLFQQSLENLKCFSCNSETQMPFTCHHS